MAKNTPGGPTTESLREALRSIADPASGKDIVTAGLVEGVELRGGLVQVSLLTDRAHAAAMEPVRRAVEALLGRATGDHQCVRGAHRAQGTRCCRARRCWPGAWTRAWPRAEAAPVAARR